MSYGSMIAMNAAAFIAALLLGLSGYAQYPISMPFITTCTGVLEDTGGPNAPYGNNENFISTICPDEEGRIRLEFVIFDLPTGAPFPVDRLVIYDGNSTSAPSFGSFTGTSLQSMTITASGNDPSGCLTLHFISNGSGVGNFAASISCQPFCDEPPVAELVLPAGAGTLCIDDLLVLDGSGSTAAPVQTIEQYIWNVNGIVVDTTGSPVHTVSPGPGGVTPISLTVITDAGCISAPSGPDYALVSGPVEFQMGPLPAMTCAGSTLQLEATASLPPLVLQSIGCTTPGQGMYIQDDVGANQTAVATVSSAAPGELITSVDQLGEFCVEMEHSFMGDLVVSLTCPNGTTVALHQQGGGGTYLGAPIDDDGSQVPGECWNYCWSPTATEPTWAELANSGVSVLPPGTYSSVEPLDAFIGCPINGDWSITFVDLWAADNGYLCSFCTGFSNNIDSSWMDLGPIPGTTPDSAYWSGPGVANDPIEGGIATVQMPQSGEIDLLFTMIDSYGCQHDTLVNIAIPTLVADAGSDIALCDSIGQLHADGNTTACTYELVLMDSFGDAWNGMASIAVIVGVDTAYYRLDIYAQFTQTYELLVSPGQELELYYTEGALFNNENSFVLIDQLGNELYASGPDPDAGFHYSTITNCDLQWDEMITHWSPTSGLSDPNALDPLITTTASGWYTFSISFADEPSCIASDSIWVNMSDVEELAVTVDIGTMTICADMDAAEYQWWLDGILQTQYDQVCITNAAPGIWWVAAVPDSGCTSVGEVQLCVPIAILWEGEMLSVPDLDGEYSWSFNGSLIPDATGPQLPIIGNGTYAVQLISSVGCISNATIELLSVDVQQIHGDLWIHLFPNPSTGEFQLSAAGISGDEVEVQLMDMTGRMVHTGTLRVAKGELLATVSPALTPGTYLVQVSDGARKYLQRLIIQ